MEKVTNGVGPGYSEAFYVDVSASDAEQLLTEAQVFVDSPASEITGQTTIITTTVFSASEGVVRRASVIYDSTHGTAEVKTTITSETAEFYHKGH